MFYAKWTETCLNIEIFCVCSIAFAPFRERQRITAVLIRPSHTVQPDSFSTDDAFSIDGSGGSKPMVHLV